MNINRRRFIKLSSVTTASLPFLTISSIANTPLSPRNVQLGQELYESFKNPEGKYRPFVRWWWNGNRLEKKEILRELDVMKAAGIGGVEINPIKFPNNTDTLGLKSLEWLSDEWISMLEMALNGAKERGIICDMIVGSGWPFGGEFLSREDQIQMIALGTRRLEGGREYKISKQELLDDVNPDFHSKHDDRLKELMEVKLVPFNLDDLDECTNLTDQFINDTLIVNVPTGKYELYYLVKMTGFMAVINGAPGAGGPVLNHYSKSAVEKYLNRMSDKITAHIGPLGNYFRAFFTDSLELEGSNWSEDMLEQFKERKGYDLAPYFPFILFKVGEMGNAAKEIYGSELSPRLQQIVDRARYDFEDVRVALFKERFIDTFVSWCHVNGVQSRMQAYGRECNPVEASMLIDIPECETWLGNGEGTEFSDSDYRRGRTYTMSNKLVSSGAHLAGKKLISCEEITNTNMVFNATLEQIKIAGDQSILSGVTHCVLHGFNYSPLEAPFPGWIRYGTFLNERNTWWPYFKKWADYKARLYSILQNAEMQADIAILPPLADLSMKFGFQRDPFPDFAYPKYVYQIWETMHQNGNGCDYITENIIQQATIRKGYLTFGTRSYKTLVLIDVDSLLPETAKAINAFTSAGGKLICIEKAPNKSPSNQKSLEDNEIIDILKDTDIKNAGIVSAPIEEFVGWYQNIQQKFEITPYVEIINPNKFVSQVYYKADDMDIFFFSNYNSKNEYPLHAKFAIQGKKAWIWDPETGTRLRYPTQGSHNELQILLEPSASKMIVFDKEEKGEKFIGHDFKKETATTIATPWNVVSKKVSGESRTLSLEKLIDLTQREDFKTFAGTIIYENVFKMPKENSFKFLQLGEAYGIAEIEINNQKVGVQWYGTPVFDISTLVKEGDNRIRIKFVTTLGNYVKSLKNNRIAQVWTRNQPLHPIGLIGPVQLL